MDLNGLSWKEAWEITQSGRGCRRNNQKTVVKDLFWLPCDGYWGNTIVGDTMFYDCSKYTNQTVRPEALEKWSLISSAC
ncbi:hypothetical protein CsSME_00043520 [Camellia sinensis var. sinensis]